MQRGFTIIETLIYLALFALIIGGFIVSVYALFASGDRNQTKDMLQEEKNFLVAKINWAMSGAQTISSPSAGTSGSILSLTKYDGSTETIALAGTDMKLNGNILNNTNVTISNVVFIHTYSGGTNPDSVEAGFTISARTPQGSLVSQSASTTRYIRK